MPVQVTFKLSEDSKRFLRRFPDKFKKRLYRGLYLAAKFAERKAKQSFGGSGKLKTRTGTLRRSIQSTVDGRAGDDIKAVLFSNLIYSRIHELGGIIVPKNAEALRFQIGNNWITAQRVVIPPRPYLEPAFRDNIKPIEDIIEKEIVKSTKD